MLQTDPVGPGVQQGLKVGTRKEKHLVALEESSAHPEVVVSDFWLLLVGLLIN